jgi:site-specific recombinase XerD
MVFHLFSQSGPVLRLRAGPLGSWIDLYAQRLHDDGYSEGSAWHHVREIERFGRWLQRRRLETPDISPQLIKAYLANSRRLRPDRSSRGDGAALRRLLELLRKQDVIHQAPVVVSQEPIRRVEDDFRHYLSVERGLSAASLANYLPPVSQLLVERFGAGPIRLDRLRAPDITGFVQRHAHELSAGRAKLMVSGLRSFLRHLQHRGDISADLALCVPCVPRWSLSGVPKFLQPGQVQRVLDHCNRRDPSGLRDYAILLLLARLGLRAGEIVSLTLEDIDWRAGQLTLHCKGRRSAQMPLITEVGEALAGYLQRGRPKCKSRHVFVRDRAPRTAFSSSSAICCIVDRALTRAGVESARRGAHLFRHTLATDMLRQGASLNEIGRLLRHRHSSTTLIYAKVDLTALRTLAGAWPGGVL